MTAITKLLRERASLAGKAAALGVLLFAERRFPLRQQTQCTGRRLGRNLIVAATAAATILVFEKPVVDRIAKRVKGHRLGVLPRCRLPPAMETVAAALLMDYTLFIWHYLNHRVAWLWRFHLPHHVDLDMDASTALRFHFGELALSTLWRALQVRLIGVTPERLALWQQLTTAAILFHHANLRLPHSLDTALCTLIVTPRMHDVHHSRRDDETNSNWSSGLSIWDRLHGTFRSSRATSSQGVGVPPFDRPSQVTLGKVLALPFRRQATRDEQSEV